MPMPDEKGICHLSIPAKEVVVVQRKGFPDQVCINTTMPSPWPAYPKEILSLNFMLAPGTAMQYCQENFPGLPGIILDIESGNEREF